VHPNKVARRVLAFDQILNVYVSYIYKYINIKAKPSLQSFEKREQNQMHILYLYTVKYSHKSKYIYIYSSGGLFRLSFHYYAINMQAEDFHRLRITGAR
jgi:hypothetical protein